MQIAITELPLSGQTAYAQLLEAALSAEHLRSVAELSGSFAPKTVKGNKYWYYQYTEPSGQLRQIFVGPDNAAVQSLIERKTSGSGLESIGRLARSAVALGCTEILPRHMRVIQRLSEYGFFRAGGVLIGTHAFLAYANMFGVRWSNGYQTQDVDFAHAGKNVAIALPNNAEVNVDSAIESLEMGLLPITSLTSGAGATYLNPADPEFRLDFLTTLHRGKDEAYKHPQLGVTLQPLKFMEFSLEQVHQAVLISGDKAVVVNVPSPARFALHKLIVYGERKGTFATKSNKDLAQAGLLLTYLKAHRPSEVQDAMDDLMGRGKGWTSRVQQGLQALDNALPELDVLGWLEHNNDSAPKP